MDRQIVYAGSIPLDTDLLYLQRNVQTAIGALARLVLGDGPVVDGLACAPGAGAYQISIGEGSWTGLLAGDFAPFGALGVDGTPVVRTGLLLGNTVLQLSAPPDAAHALSWLVQAAVSEADTGPVALPYWNAANPSVPYSGPGNSGVAQNTQRVLRVALSVKGTGPQGLGSVVPPSPDPGCVGLHVVTTYFGQPSVGAGDIVTYADAPRLRFKLPYMPPGYSRQAVFTATGGWPCPEGVRVARVRLVGGGGGGGGGEIGYSGGGGGAGGYSESLVAVEPGQVYPVVIGTGGIAAGSGVTGGGGGPTSFGTVVAASGGQGGGSNNPDCHGGSSGLGTLGTVQQPGGVGGDGAEVVNVPGGNGGASAFGGGGRGANQGGVAANGMASGSGAGGGYGPSSSGGAGQSGLVVLEY